MPIRNQRQLSRGTYTLDSDSDDDLIELHLSRYQEAEYGTALSTRWAFGALTEGRCCVLLGLRAYLQGQLYQGYRGADSDPAAGLRPIRQQSSSGACLRGHIAGSSPLHQARALLPEFQQHGPVLV